MFRAWVQVATSVTEARSNVTHAAFRAVSLAHRLNLFQPLGRNRHPSSFISRQAFGPLISRSQIQTLPPSTGKSAQPSSLRIK